MKLIKQATLHFQEGSSDKIYEADLCDVGSGQFVVNFRYGRRGGTLKEGTKTKSPVTEAKANSEFTKLVNSKAKKGYEIIAGVGDLSDFGFDGEPEDAEDAPQNAADIADRDARILGYLKDPDLAEDWPLSRIIWRAGELRLTGAESLIWTHMKSNDNMLNYCIAWALGRLGGLDSLVRMQYMAESQRYGADVKRIAEEAKRAILDRAGRLDEFVQTIIPNLPVALENAYKNKDADQLKHSLSQWLGGDRTATPKDFLVYETLYQIDDALTRPLVLEFIKTTPLTPPHFRVVRHLLKMSELRLDGQVFGAVAHRFAMTRENYSPTSWQHSWGKEANAVGTLSTVVKSQYIQEHNNPNVLWGRLAERKETKAEDTTLAYSKATRQYMRRRIWRILRRLGEQQDPAYVSMAVGTMLPYKTEHAQNAQSRRNYRYDYKTYRWVSTTTDYGPWARFITLNYLLYLNSDRFEYKHGRSAWRVVSGKSHDSARRSQAQAEEAFPELWDAQPQGLLHLLDESAVEQIHEFAVVALERNMAFCKSLPMDAVLMLLDAPFEITASFGFELFKALYDKKKPDIGALAKLATCAYGRARIQGVAWLRDHKALLLKDDHALYILMTSPYGSARDFARTILTKNTVADSVFQKLMTRIVAHLMTMPSEDEVVALAIANMLKEAFGQQLSSVGASVINDLLSRNFEATHLLAAYILQQQGDFIHINHVKGLIASTFALVRAIGMDIFGNLSDSALLESEALLVALSVHELPDLRTAARGPIVRLAALNTTFALNLANMLIDVLQLPEPSEGVHLDVLKLVRDDLFEHLRGLNPDIVFALLRAESSAAKELGGLLLEAYVSPSVLSVLEIVELGRNEVLAVREACWSFMTKELYRFKGAKQTALRVLDSDWEDTRQFGFNFFEEKFEAMDWSPELLVSLCDSIRHDVQQFGKKMIQTFFVEEDGLEYLIRLSEHPSINLQLFATNYLERFASNKPEEIAKLEYYFTSVLSRVNKGGVAKARIFDFFNEEASKSEASASIIGAILSRQSATIAIQDRARAIETMVNIRQIYPHIEMALTLNSTEVRHGV